MKSDVNTAELEIDKNPENDKNLGENKSNKEFNEKTINKNYKDHNRSKGRFIIKFVDRKIITDWTQKIFQCYDDCCHSNPAAVYSIFPALQLQFLQWLSEINENSKNNLTNL